MAQPVFLAVAAALALASGAAFAQSPAAPAAAGAPAATAPTAPLPTIAPHKCEKPEFPGKIAPETRIRKWSTDFRGYVDCLKVYIGERNAAIEANSKAAKAVVDEFNASVTEFNETIRSLNN
jgi:hypothetical protein